MSDTDLIGTIEPDVRAAIRGEGDATRRLWQTHRRWVAAVLLAHKPTWADLDDLLQDVAVRLVSKVSELREPATFRAWLRTIALNVARAAGRRSDRRSATSQLEEERLAAPDRDSLAPAGNVEGNEAARRVLERAMGLPESYREPLLLRAVRGMRPPQIAEALGLPETTVHTRIARARRMLRAECEDQSPGAAGNGRVGHVTERSTTP